MLFLAPWTRISRNAPIRQSDELTLALDGWEGPLDLLLTLARAQKVDLAQISILQLVEQYLTYLAEARALKLEIAADYLVMAAWLAYLKSCLLLPKDPEADPSPEEIALRLQMRLQRLDAMREAGARLLGRDRVGRDVFLRGAPEGLRLVRKAIWQVRDFDLFAAYGAVRARTQPAMHVVHARSVMTLEEAIERVARDDRHGARLDLPRKLPARNRRICSCGARRWRRASSPRSSSPGAAGSTSPRTSRLRRSCSRGRRDG